MQQIGKESDMFTLPRAAEPLVSSFCVAFSRPSFQRARVLLVGAILAMGRRTVTNVLWTVRSIASGHFSSYHRLFSRAPWSLWPLGKALATAALRWIPEDQPVLVAADDTVAQHRGPKVYGKAKHRDGVRSSHSLTVWKWGHKWVALAIVVQFPFTSRRWALPILCALYRSKEQNKAEGRRHKTPTQLARQLMAVLIHWFPQRKFVFLGDGGFGSHELARFFARHHRHATLVSRFYADAALYAPPTRNRIGRPRIKGRKLPSPRQTVAQRKHGKHATVTWYGGSTRRVELVSDVGQWYRIGQGLVPVRWVHVHDLEGTHRDDWVYSTDPTLSPAQTVSFFTGRWPIETTFQEVRHHLGFETTRQRVDKSVLRAAPCLLGLFSVVCLIYAEHVKHAKVSVHQTPWYVKCEPTFSDALATVRRLLWEQTLFKQPRLHRGYQKLPPPLRRTLLDLVSRAA
jgi:hypothetical protein